MFTRERAALPTRPILFNQGNRFCRFDVSGNDQRRVFRPIPAVEERFGILELVGHVFDVADETHGGVFIRVRGEGMLALNLQQFVDRIGAVLVVLTQDSACFGLEGSFRIREVLEAIGFNLEHRLQIFLGERDVIVGVVVSRIRVLAGSCLGQDLLILFGRIGLGSPKHHVLEEVSKSGLARLHFIARTGLNRNLNGSDVWETGGDDDDFQTIG